MAYVVDMRTVMVAPVDVDGRPGGPARIVSAGADFAVDPAWSPDGRWLVWHEWDVPAMAWDQSRIRMAPADGRGSPLTVAGGPGVSVQQPRFSPDGSRLGYVSDAGGWANLWVADASGGGARPLVEEAWEHAGPTWGCGQRSWAWSPDGSAVVFDRNEAGFGRLCVVDVGSGRVRALSRGVHTYLSWAGGRVGAVRSGARTPTTVVTLDAADGGRTVVARGPVGGFEAAGLVEPELVEWHSFEGATLHGRLYRPVARPDGSPPPLVLRVHGGPTDQHRVVFDPTAALLVDRGFAVLVADFRGSTGWGRSYTQALQGGWGAVDVDDLAAGLVAAAERGWGDARRLAVMGSSSGGMAVLLLMARHPELCAAGVALYPVSDLAALAATTHRLEAHYTWSLVGPPAEAAETYRQRSPLTVADAIRGPLLVLHGSADEVVAAGQSVALVARVREHGGMVEHHEYQGEGHGWRRPGTAADALGRIEAFLLAHTRGAMDR
ncbi:MAG: S9 family peptidase, partial [Acidimicrobiales bacterium]